MKVLILEDDYERILWFSNNMYLHKIMFVQTAEQAIKFLQSETFDIVFLDHDLCDEHYKYVTVPLDADFEKFCQENLDATTGFAVARFLAENPQRSPNAQIIIHTMNTVAQKRMSDELRSRNHVVLPFDYMQRKGFRWVDIQKSMFLRKVNLYCK